MRSAVSTHMNSNLERKKWGERDHLFAVSTWKGKKRGSPGAWQLEEFYKVGETDWMDFKHHWENFGLAPGHCIKIGCGAGRITKQLGLAIDKVTATDVFEHQLSLLGEAS